MTVMTDARRLPRHRWPTISHCDRELRELAPRLAGADVFDAHIARMAVDDVLDRRLELMHTRDAAKAAKKAAA